MENIHIDNIYCNHYLKTKNLKKIINTSKYPIIENKLHTGLHIEDSIHYNSLLSNNFNLYNELITKTKQKEHSVKNFKKLIATFSIKNMEKIKISFNKNYNKFIIIDGVHRLSILLFKKYLKNKLVPIEYLQIV